MALGKTLAEVDALSAREFLSWEKYYAIEPFGWEAEEPRYALLAHSIYQASSKRFKPLRMAQFQRQYRPPLSVEQQIAALKAIFPDKREK